MKLEQIPGDYDNVDQRALELLKTNDYKLAEYMRDYIKEFVHISRLEVLPTWITKD